MCFGVIFLKVVRHENYIGKSLGRSQLHHCPWMTFINADHPNFQIYIHIKEITLQNSFRPPDKQHNWHYRRIAKTTFFSSETEVLLAILGGGVAPGFFFFQTKKIHFSHPF